MGNGLEKLEYEETAVVFQAVNPFVLNNLIVAWGLGWKTCGLHF